MVDASKSSSAGYADRLSRGHDRGTLNLTPVLDTPLLVQRKVAHLAKLIREAKHVVLHTGAGLSTAAGISDFRGPNGIWTTEMRKRMAEKDRGPPTKRSKYAESDEEGDGDGDGEDIFDMAETPAVDEGMQWDEPPTVVPSCLESAVPTLSHAVIARLVQKGWVQTIVTQNVDNLHQRSGVARGQLAEIHGNLRVEWCPACKVEYERDFEVRSAGFRATGNRCAKCGGPLTDKQLDWENALPEADEARAEEARKGDLHIVIGSSNQMVPAREYPFVKGKRRRSVIINLSPTPKDGDAGMVIRARADTVLALLADYLKLEVTDWRHEAVLSLKVWQSANHVVAGLHTNLGADLDCDARIPFLKSVDFDVDACLEVKSQTKCVLHGLEKPAEIRCDAVLSNDTKVELNVVYRGEKVSVSKKLVVRRVIYRDAVQREVELLKRKMNDRCSWSHFIREPRAWLVSAEKARYSECVFCGHAMYSGGGRWLAKATEHLRNCICSVIGVDPLTNSHPVYSTSND